MAEAIAVLPLAAVEQHGPHLPTGVDAMIMEGMIAAVRAELEQAPAQTPLTVFLPVQEIGLSTEHIAFAGSLTSRPKRRSAPGARSPLASAAPAFASWCWCHPMAATAR